jgi:hypothetical protein
MRGVCGCELLVGCDSRTFQAAVVGSFVDVGADDVVLAEENISQGNHMGLE